MRNIPLRINKTRTKRADLYTDTAQECNDRNEEVMNCVKSGGVALTPRPIVTDPAFYDEDPDQHQLSKAFSSIALAGQRFSGLVSRTTIILRRVGQSPILTPNALIEGMEVVFTVGVDIAKMTSWKHVQVGSIPPTEVYFDANKTPIPSDFLLTQQVVRCVYLNGFFVVYSKAYRVYKEATDTLLPIGDIQMKAKDTTDGWVPLDGRSFPSSSPVYKRLKDSCTKAYLDRWGFILTNTEITIPKLESGSVFNTYEIAGKYDSTWQEGLQDHKHIGGHMITDAMLWGYFGVTDREESDYVITLAGGTQKADKNWEFGFIDLPTPVSTVVGRYDGTEVDKVVTTTVNGGSIKVETDVLKQMQQYHDGHSSKTTVPPGSLLNGLASLGAITKIGDGRSPKDKTTTGDEKTQEEKDANREAGRDVVDVTGKLSNELRKNLEKYGRLKTNAEIKNAIVDHVFSGGGGDIETTLHNMGLPSSIKQAPGESIGDYLQRVRSGLDNGQIIPHANTPTGMEVDVSSNSPGNTDPEPDLHTREHMSFEEYNEYKAGIADGKTPTQSLIDSTKGRINPGDGGIFNMDPGTESVFEQSGKDGSFLGDLLKGAKAPIGKALGFGVKTLSVVGDIYMTDQAIVGVGDVGAHDVNLFRNMQKAMSLTNSEKAAIRAKSPKARAAHEAWLKAAAKGDGDEMAKQSELGNAAIAEYLGVHQVDDKAVSHTQTKVLNAIGKDLVEAGKAIIDGALQASPESKAGWTETKEGITQHILDHDTVDTSAIGAGLSAVGKALGGFWSGVKGLFSKAEQKGAESIATGGGGHHTSSGSTSGGGSLSGGSGGHSSSGGGLSGVLSSVGHSISHAAHSIAHSISNAIHSVFHHSDSHSSSKSDSKKD